RSRYGQRHGLTGFDGLVRFWVDLRSIAERVFRELDWRKLAIDNTAQQWTDYDRQICDFLSLTLQVDEALRREEYLGRYAGAYTYQRPGPPRRVGGEPALAVGPPDRRVGGLRRLVPGRYQKDIEFAIRLEGGELVMHDYGWLWPTNRLIPKEKDVFHIASFPFHLVFERDGAGEVVSATRVNPFGRWLVTGQKYPRRSEGKGDPQAHPASRPAPRPRDAR
ncbi:MAG: hypothetical protein ABIL09_10920, partial [Gemmatimonadota bacterium]